MRTSIPLRVVMAAACLVLALAAALPPADANWLARFGRGSEATGTLGRGARHGAGALEGVAAHVRNFPGKDGSAVLAAHAGQEGHWTLVNRTGERVTAAGPEELKRALAVLAPEAAATGGVPLALVLSEETIFARTRLLADLPKSAALSVLVNGQAYRVLASGEGAARRLFAEIRPNLVAELADQARFDEAVWQLARPLRTDRIRIVALEPGNAAGLSPAPKLDKASGKALVDTIDPANFARALDGVAGQTVIVTGRIEGERLVVKPASGPERSLLLADLARAAEAADVNLFVLKSASPRQPGGRNWLWQRVAVKGLDDALARASVADFLAALGGADARLAVTAAASSDGALRTVLDVAPLREAAGALGGSLGGALGGARVGEAVTGIVAEVTGHVLLAGVHANIRSAERERELDLRIVPGVPSALQWNYVMAVLLGLIGWPVARGWFERIWPAERAGEYAGRMGYRAAAAARALAFGLLFMPLVGIASAPLQILRRGWFWATWPGRWWSRKPGPRTAV